MKARKLKKVLLPVLSLSLATILTVTNVHATEKAGNEDVLANEDTQISEAMTGDETATSAQNELGVLVYSAPDIWNAPYAKYLPVVQGNTLADTYHIEIVNINNVMIPHSIKVTNEMISGFDNNTLGVQNVTITYEGASTTLPVRVIDASDIDNVIDISVDAIPFLPIGASTDLGTIQMFDGRGNIASHVTMTSDMISGFDNTTLGKRQYTVTYEGFSATFETEIVRYRLIIPEQTIPLGGEICLDGTVELVDADSSRKFGTAHISNWSFIESPWDLIDNTKAGVQEIELKSEEFGVILTGTMKVTVGTPSQMTVDKLPSKAQATMPGGTFVGTWDVPSGEAGAGTWTFQTDLPEGTEVVVWSFHDNEWLKIGVYKVDAYGFVTVTFTANQLSPILITKNDDNSGKETNNNTTPNNISNPDVSTKTPSPQTGDNTNTIALYIVSLLSLIVLTILTYMKRNKNIE